MEGRGGGMSDDDEKALFDLVNSLNRGEHIPYEFREPFISAIYNLVRDNSYLTEENSKLKERNHLLETLGPDKIKAEDELFAKVYAESFIKNDINPRGVFPGGLNYLIAEQEKQKAHLNALGAATRAVNIFRNR